MKRLLILILTLGVAFSPTIKWLEDSGTVQEVAWIEAEPTLFSSLIADERSSLTHEVECLALEEIRVPRSAEMRIKDSCSELGGLPAESYRSKTAVGKSVTR